MEAIQRLRTHAWKQYRIAKPTAAEKRELFIENQAKKKKDVGDHKSAKQIRALKKAEFHRKSQREVNHITKVYGTSNILHIEIPDPYNANLTQKISEQSEMETIMHMNFKSKFMEVYDTPIVHNPFTNILGYNGLTSAASEILNGSYKFPPVIHPDIVEFSNTWQHQKKSLHRNQSVQILQLKTTCPFGNRVKKK